MLEKRKSIYDDAIIHYYPGSPCIAKVAVNFRRERQIWQSIVMKDIPAALDYFARHQDFCDIPYRIITHKV